MSKKVFPDNGFKIKGSKLTFDFDNEEACNHFKLWLCEQGEQSYWEWMQYREEEELDKKDITGIEFEYWEGQVIKVSCGRMDDDK